MASAGIAVSAYVIAEIGSNHDGSLNQAEESIAEAAQAGADAVKFQCLPNLPREWMPELMEFSRGLGVDCFASVFDVDAVRAMVDLGVPYLKIASPEMVDRELLRAAADTGIPLLVSTGMASTEEISQALRVAARLPHGLTLLQCVVAYPAPPEKTNLHAMVAMQRRFGVPVGLSDHSLSTSIPAAAVALGATVIEKHFTLPPERCADPDGPDHAFALWPSAFRAMVDGIREVEVAMGDGRKDGPVEGEPMELRGRKLRWDSP